MRNGEVNRETWLTVSSGRRRTTGGDHLEAVQSVSTGRRRGGEGNVPETTGEEKISLRMRCATLLGVIALVLCGGYLCLVLTGRPASGGGFPEAGRAVREAILEEEALAVFLGLEEASPADGDPFGEDAVLTMGTATGDSFLPEKPNVGGDGWNFWDYIAGLLAPLLEKP